MGRAMAQGATHLLQAPVAQVLRQKKRLACVCVGCVCGVCVGCVCVARVCGGCVCGGWGVCVGCVWGVCVVCVCACVCVCVCVCVPGRLLALLSQVMERQWMRSCCECDPLTACLQCQAV